MIENRHITGDGVDQPWPAAKSTTIREGEPARAPARPAPPDRRTSHVASPISTPDTPVIGYASCFSGGRAATRELKEQAKLIAHECNRRGLHLIEVAAEHEPPTGKGLARPALSYALDRIRAGEAKGLVVAELSRITHSAAELGTIIEWLTTADVRLVAALQDLDTECQNGRLAAQMLIEVSRWERTRLSERTRNGLQAARMSGRSTGRGAVTDHPELRERITEMRARGMTLQAIADQLNAEGVPTVRGGAKWRHSSVQAVTGYRRRQHPLRIVPMMQPPPGPEQAAG
jgi:DNA invertase Pin-like site-specific DNA recombinase